MTDPLVTVSGVRGEDGQAVMNETRSEKWRRLSRSSDWLALEMEANREIAAALKAARFYPADVNRPNADNTSRHLALRGELEDSQRRESAWARKCHDLEVRLDEVVSVGQEIEQERLDQHHARKRAEDHLAAVRAICAAAHPYEDFGAFIDRIEAATINGSAPASPGEYEAGIRRWGRHEPEKAGYRNLTPEECGRLDDAAAAVLRGNTRELADVVADIKASMTLPELQVADRMPSDHQPQAESMAEAEFWRVIWRRFDYEETATWAVDAWGEALQAALAAGSTPITDEPSALPTPSPS